MSQNPSSSNDKPLSSLNANLDDLFQSRGKTHISGKEMFIPSKKTSGFGDDLPSRVAPSSEKEVETYFAPQTVSENANDIYDNFYTENMTMNQTVTGSESFGQTKEANKLKIKIYDLKNEMANLSPTLAAETFLEDIDKHIQDAKYSLADAQTEFEQVRGTESTLLKSRHDHVQHCTDGLYQLYLVKLRSLQKQWGYEKSGFLLKEVYSRNDKINNQENEIASLKNRLEGSEEAYNDLDATLTKTKIKLDCLKGQTFRSSLQSFLFGATLTGLGVAIYFLSQR